MVLYKKVEIPNLFWRFRFFLYLCTDKQIGAKQYSLNTNNMKKFFTLAAMLVMALTASAGLTQKAQGGWFESCWMEFTGLSSDYTLYNGYVSADGGSSWTQLDGELIRSYGTYGRVDALGLTAGTNYKLKVVPVKDNAEVAADAVVSSAAMEVKSYDRSGFAHFNYTGVGAYNDNGTLKDNAVVLYVTDQTAKTVSMEVASDNKGGKTKFTGLQAIVTAYQKGIETKPLCVRFIGKVTADGMDGFDSSSEGLQIKGKSADAVLNMTFEGVGNDAFIYGFGFLVRNAKSVEMRNFGVATLMDDDISLDTDNSNIWIHNIDTFYGPNKGGDQKKGDGAIDVKSDSKFVTISYCHFWDTGKSTMCGMKSESGENYITYHHNWFDHSDSRHARVRTMAVHMYNNYYDGVAKYGSGACTGANVFMDRNYFKNTPKPFMISMQGTDTKNGTDEKNAPTFSKEDGGMIKAYGNVYSGTSVEPTAYSPTNNVHFDCFKVDDPKTEVPSGVKAKQGGATYNGFDTNGKMYSTYAVDEAANVPSVVSDRTWGAGRCQGGDFEFTFTDADNALYEVNTALRSAIEGYTSKFVKIIGKDVADDGTDPEPTDPTDTRADSQFALTSATSVTIDQGSTTTIENNGNNAGTVTYTSNNTSIATVSADGVITGVAAGKTMITVTDPGSAAVKGKTITVSVTVAGVVVDDGDVTIQAGELPYGYEVDESSSTTQYVYKHNKNGGYDWSPVNLYKTGKAQHEIAIPAGVKVTKVIFYGVTDDNSEKSVLSELAGKAYSQNLANRQSTNGPTTVQLDGLAVENVLTYTITTKNAAVKLSLTVEKVPTDVKGVESVNESATDAKKFIKAGQIIIIKGDKQYNAAGAQVK